MVELVCFVVVYLFVSVSSCSCVLVCAMANEEDRGELLEVTSLMPQVLGGEVRWSRLAQQRVLTP